MVDALEQAGQVAMRNQQGFTPFLAAAQNGQQTDICCLWPPAGTRYRCELGVSRNPPEALHLAATGGH